MKEIYIIGAGTYGEVMYELAEACGYKVKGYYDEDESKIGTLVMDVPVLGKFSKLDDATLSGENFIVAIGNNKIRYDIMTDINNHGGFTPTLIHPSAQISKSAKIGKGVYIQMNAVIWTKVVIEDFVIISPHAVVAHHANVGAASLISTQAMVGASVSIGKYCFFGIKSTVITGVKNVGANVMLGAAATVVKDVGENLLLIGTPAKVLREMEPIKEKN